MGERAAAERKHKETTLTTDLANAVAAGDTECLDDIERGLLLCGWTTTRFQEHLLHEEKKQSENAGISVAYMLSEGFTHLAQQRSALDDPSFYDLKDPFFVGAQALGRQTRCPRDRRKGCALVDFLPRVNRGRC